MHIKMLHNGRDRDSLLMPMEPTRLDLMLQYSVQLIRCEPTSHFNVLGTRCSGNGILHDEFGTFHLERWEEAEWTSFRDAFVETITRYWDGKFELTPNRAWYEGRTGEAATEARVRCSLSLGVVDQPARANHRYWIIKPRETSFRSFASAENRVGLFTHRDLSYEWKTRRTRIGRARHSVSYLQNTVLHEFGHTMGLDHVNGAGNTDAHYGTTLEQREDVMGLGDHLTARAAQPWIRQMRHHLQPAPRETVPRFTARVTAPQLITYWDNDWRPSTAAAPAAH